MTGPLQVGCVFVWSTGGLRITSTIRELEPLAAIIWEGEALGMHARHAWKLTQQDSAVRVITEETMSGWLTAVLKLFNRDFLDSSLDRTLKALKKKAQT